MKMQTSDLVAMISDGSDLRDLLTDGSGYDSPMTLHKLSILPDRPHLALENKAMFYMALKMMSAELDARVPPRAT